MIDEIDEETVKQIYSFLNHPAFAKTYIAIMPDCHAGAGAVIGFTAKMNNYVIPNVVGVDIGCGVLSCPLPVHSIDFEELDNFIKANIPSGFSIRNYSQRMINGYRPDSYIPDDSEIMYYANETKQESSRVKGSLGTLGGGNHFIEIDEAEDGTYWLLVHSGSRNFGLKIANYYQNKAKELLKEMFVGASAYHNLEYLPMEHGGYQYLQAMRIAQHYATLNRGIMLEIILNYFGVATSQTGGKIISPDNAFDTVHNYINFKDKIIRKGAVAAHDGERLVIPFNMRDGVAVCIGKGNQKWNYSAPHGAGRILSRKKAKATLSMDEFTAQMDGIYTTTATLDTIDESPMAYKDKDMIVDAIGETVDIEFMMKPVYNFKAGGD